MRDKRKEIIGKNIKFLIIKAVLLVLIIAGCSSAPSRPEEDYTDRDTALKQLNLANEIANRGRYEDALLMLEEARRLAVSADDPSLRIRTSISKGSFLFSLGREMEAFQEWESASAEGEASGEPALAALARINSIRASLLLPDANGVNVEESKTLLNREMAIVRSDPVSTATVYVVLGIAEKQLGHWAEAESLIRRALDTHEKNRDFEEAAYDWFLIASVRSVAGNYEAALEALRTAIRFDRRAENGFGLASSWEAMGEVYLKAGRLEESQAAFRRSAEIFRAIGLAGKAEQLEE